ncbi:MAG: 5'-methylthioadenosine/S-adenosylhomocysteine nucleosidase family protein, partial [Candidatus Aminicenantales bacterium]
FVIRAVILLGLQAILAIALPAGQTAGATRMDAAVLVSADAEWSFVRSFYSRERYESSPYGQYFIKDILLPDKTARRVVVLHGGWGKVAAAASTQYVIDRWNPPLLVNLGTCGGFKGAVERLAVVLATKTVIYDIVERMGNPEEAVADYGTAIDLGWLTGRDPAGVRRSVLVSADQDVDPTAIRFLISKYGAIAADWESGAIAWTARKNNKRILILRGVTDLVGAAGGEAYGRIDVFKDNTEIVMKRLFADLPLWLARIRED